MSNPIAKRIARFAAPLLFALLVVVGVVLAMVGEARPSTGRPFSLAGPRFRVPGPAIALAERLRAEAVDGEARPAFVVALDADNGAGRWYRVLLGAFDDAAQARNAAALETASATPLKAWEVVDLRKYGATLAGLDADGPPPPAPVPPLPSYVSAEMALGALPLPPGFEVERLIYTESILINDEGQRRRSLHGSWLDLPKQLDLEKLIEGASGVCLARIRDSARGTEVTVLALSGGVGRDELMARLPTDGKHGNFPVVIPGIGTGDAASAQLHEMRRLPKKKKPKPRAKKRKRRRRGRRRPYPTPTPTPKPSHTPTPQPTVEYLPLGWNGVVLDALPPTHLIVLYASASEASAQAYLADAARFERSALDDEVVRWHLAMLPAAPYPGDGFVAFALRRMRPEAEAYAPPNADDPIAEELEEAERGADVDDWRLGAEGFYRTWVAFTAEDDANWSVLLRPFAGPATARGAFEQIYLGRRQAAARAVMEKRLKTPAAMGYRQVEVAGQEGAWYIDDYYLSRRQELYFQVGRFTASVRAYPDKGEPFPWEDLRSIAESLRIFER